MKNILIYNIICRICLERTRIVDPDLNDGLKEEIIGLEIGTDLPFGSDWLASLKVDKIILASLLNSDHVNIVLSQVSSWDSLGITE